MTKGDGTNKFILTEFDADLYLDFSDDFTGTAGVFDVSAHFANGAVVSVVDGDNYLGDLLLPAEMWMCLYCTRNYKRRDWSEV